MTTSDAWAPLRYSAFRWLAFGRSITMLGNAIAPIALAFAVLDLTGSVRDLGFVIGARSLTQVLCLPLGGVVADRVSRQVVMVIACLTASFTQGIIAALILTGSTGVGALAGIGALNGVAAGFAFPAASALTAQTVPSEILRRANAILRLGVNSAMIMGAASAGVIVAIAGAGWALAIDAITFAVAAVLFSRLRIPSPRQPSSTTLRATQNQDGRGKTIGVTAELREGWTEFSARTWLWVVVLAFLFINAAMAGVIGVLGPAIADATIGRPAWGFTVASQMTGMVIGGLIALRLNASRLLLLGVASMLGVIPMFISLGLAPLLWLLIVTAFVSGIAQEQFAVSWETTVQDHIPADKLARVYSFDILGSMIAIPIGEIAAGPIAQRYGLEAAALGAAGIVFVAIVGMLSSREIRTLRNRTDATRTVMPDGPSWGSQP